MFTYTQIEIKKEMHLHQQKSDSKAELDNRRVNQWLKKGNGTMLSFAPYQVGLGN